MVVLVCLLISVTAFVPSRFAVQSRSALMAGASPLTPGSAKKSAPAPAKKAAPAPAAAAAPAKKTSPLGIPTKKAAPAPAKKSSPLTPAASKAAPAPAKKASPLSFSAPAKKAAPAPAKKAAPAPAKKAAPAPAKSAIKKVSAPAKVFTPSGNFAYGLVGADTEAGEFDPLGFSSQVDEATVQWYRAAELKHGRVCMVAALGLLFAPTNANFHWVPDSLFEEQGGIAALNKIGAERPEAILQILTAIAAVEVATLFRGGVSTGDLDWDPLNFKAKYTDQDAMQLRELKNGRLAMLGTTAMLLQESISGKGVWEQLQ